MKDFHDVAEAISTRKHWNADTAVGRSKTLELGWAMGDTIVHGLRKGRMLKGILQDFVLTSKLRWYEVVVLLAVLTSNVNTLLWLTLVHATFELSQLIKQASG